MSDSKCPVDHSSFANLKRGNPASPPAASACPVDHAALSPPPAPAPSECPVDHSSDGVNPLNMMPKLGQDRAPGQVLDLSTQRTVSTIPRADAADESHVADKNWMYPSPQQFYNALKRKGWETPEHEIEGMVDIHNFLNEGCWQEILEWEKEFHCDCNDIKLSRFQGRPQELTPKARFFTWFGVEKPFDRHDWTIDRCGTEVRYIIDYYSAPDVAPGVPAFNVDVRPALDSPGAAFDRSRRAAREVWDRCFGGFGGQGTH
ncbi:cytochrome c/c1 heme-lyase [Blyttiomyces helicus]|uniref:Holocytochrome c-type synthase n=1 Tax=Blyttiomyces helicus TaxID=388810 RepID=A0A4P9WMC9_9FUNG|nr:cytochrome c/c1 heme-lyase [Blyttiomyces helicus]|eukprot:RKO92828.1 cytochrome c/c1 heme-lyase [Blyttiomyces helicus]